MFFAWLKRGHQKNKAINITTSASTTGQIDARSYAGGTVRVTGSVTTLTFWAKQSEDDTPLQYYDRDDAIVTLAVSTTKETQLPAAFYDLAFCVVVGDNTGTATFSLKG